MCDGIELYKHSININDGLLFGVTSHEVYVFPARFAFVLKNFKPSSLSV